MKTHHILSLLQQNYNTISVAFLADGKASSISAEKNGLSWGAVLTQTGVKLYTYKIKDNQKVKPGDYVVVMAPSDIPKVVVVVDVHATPNIDLDADFSYKWVIQVVDCTAYDAQLKAEKDFKQTLTTIEREKQRESLLTDFTKHLPEGSAARLKFDTAVQQLISPETKVEPGE